MLTSPATSGTATSDLPLVVDLDGTLLKTDMLAESICTLIAARPVAMAQIPLWLSRGKSVLKARIADHVTPDIASLPFNDELLTLLKEEHAAGRKIFLASASDRRYVQAIADHLGLFDGIFGSDSQNNLRGDHKARQLVEAFGDKGFDYAGNAWVDVPVWRHARQAIAVMVPADLAQAVARDFPNHRILGIRRTPWRMYAKAMRPHQWAKNTLLAIPALAAHQISLGHLGILLVAFLAISFVASATYLINDLLDLPHDRTHATKCRRPLAAGTVPLTHGLVMAPILMVLGFGTALLIAPSFFGVVALYFLLTLGYSIFLKWRTLVDVVTLAGLYTLRILAGGMAVGVTVSAWLLAWSMFLFLCLAIVKRNTELVERVLAGDEGASRRGYTTNDLPLLSALGGASGYSAVTVLALYINSPDVAALYHRPDILWLICPVLLYWVSRMLLLAHRGKMNDDPVVFALSDRVSLMCGLIVAVILGFAV